MQAFTELSEVADGYLKAAKYARGELPERFAADRIQQLIERSGKGYKFRFAKVPINVLANRVQIASILGGTDAETTRIETIRKANKMEDQEPFLIRELFTYGDGYMLVWPISPEEIEQRDGEEVDINADRALREAGIELTYQNPLSCRAFYDGEDGRRTRFVIRRWTEAIGDATRWRAELWYSDRIEAWVTLPDASGTDTDDWLPYAEDEDGEEVPVNEFNWPLFHEWQEVPIKHARNGLPYGRPEHFDAYGPQDAITKATITQVLAIDKVGWRERWRIVEDALEGRDAVDWQDNAEAPASADVVVSGRRTGAGTESIFHNTKEVGEYAAPDPGALIEPLDQWVRFMAAITETPLFEFDPRDSGQMNGIARLRAEAPLRAKEKDRKRYLEGFEREVWTLALRMSGFTDPGPIAVVWRPPEIISDPEWWMVARQRRAMGIPTEQILMEAGYPPEDAQIWATAIPDMTNPEEEETL
jgi:hypothetical protein